MKTLLTFARADWGPAFRAAAGRAAFAVACLIVAAEMSYRSGLATGRALHWLSDTLAGLASGRIDRAATARAVVAWARATLDAPAPVPPLTDMPAGARPHPYLKPATPAPAPVVMACAAAAPAAPAAGITPPPLDSLTVAELRATARARGIAGMGRARRADLLAALAAPAPAWLAVDAGSETVISEHASEADAEDACRHYRQSHPGRCPRVQKRFDPFA